MSAMLKICARFILITFIGWNCWQGFRLTALAQSPLKVEVDRQTLALDEQVSLKIMITGNFFSVPFPIFPELNEWIVVGPTISELVTVDQGQIISQRVYLYRLQPLQLGHFTIEPIRVDLDGQEFFTDPVELEVTDTPPTDSSPPSPNLLPDESQLPPPFIVEAEVDNPNPYLGQQVIYTFRLYRATILPGQPDYKAPAFTDFWSQTILSQPYYTTEISGMNYSVIEVRTAIFPATLGPITIAPSTLTIPGVLNADQTLETNPVQVRVRSLPTGAPVTFKGAVGQYKMRATVEPRHGKVNEPLILALEIEGFGNISILREPTLPKLPNWRIFNSKPTTKIEVQEAGVYGTRRFERLIFPSQAGQYIIPTIEFSYYDPQAEAYRTINSDPIPLTIDPGEANDMAPVVLESAVPEILGLKAVPTNLARETTSLTSQVLYGSCWLWSLLLIGAAWLWQKRRPRFQTPIAKPMPRQAYKSAQKILQTASLDPQQSATLIQRALLTYFAERFDQPLTGLTLAKLLTFLSLKNLPTALTTRVQTLFSEIEVYRFAPGSNKNPTALINQTQELLNDLEQALKNQ